MKEPLGAIMPRQRGETWASQETTHFLTLLGELKVQEQLNSCHRNQSVYEELAKSMAQYGYNRTAHQLRTKAKDLKRQYRQLKENNDQPSEANSFWKYYGLLDNICCNDRRMRPKAATSAVKDEKHTEEQNGASQPAGQLHSNKSQGPRLPCGRSRASRRLSVTSLGASTGSASIAQALPRRILQRPAASTRARKCWSMKQLPKELLRCNRNMEGFQQFFQDYMDIERQEREKIHREASRTRREIKTSASQMREVILAQAEAINRVAEAINRYNDLYECTISEPDPPRGEKQISHVNSGQVGTAANPAESLSPHSSLWQVMHPGSIHCAPSENLLAEVMG
ncbi:zinc finger and SCAN domain-containing protein 20-like isoform X2 [Rhineura floridana]|uniref:zinc finger and SCAN domain-containing protein 20-like isoform X2 n=1 Tax=Rhineura floridana TaxID=261503 RepID=UPI002AC82B14|nr:zinc finger and SCAN domain-containing protein 20-like isoform X2 [Rhineura floridana]